MSLLVLPASTSTVTRLCLRASRTPASPRSIAESSLRLFSTTSTLPRAFPRHVSTRHTSTPLTKRINWPSAVSSSSGMLQQRRTLWGDNDIITMYEQLPRDYKDANGLPFRTTDLSQAEVLKILGPKISVETANILLRILHGRRVAGTLDDPAFRVNTAAFSSKQIDTALEFLRKTVQVDETINAGLRAQDELEQLERQLAKEKKAKLAALEEAADTLPEFNPADVEITPDPVYGYSKFDEMRAYNKARTLAEQQRIALEEAANPKPEPGTLMELVQTGKLTPTSPSMKKWMANATISDLEEVPEMSTLHRVLPPLTFAALFLAICYACTALYEEPPNEMRFFNDLKPSTACIGTLIALNLVVYVGWRTPPLWRMMNRYFVMVIGLPRAPSVVLAMFSHSSIGHLIGNMVTLFFIGPRLHDDLGRANFLSLYLSCGIIGYVASLLWHPLNVASLGASCAVFGVLSAYFWLHRFDCFKILSLPPDPMEGVPGLVFLSLVVALHISAMMSTSKYVAKLDLASHWGGILTGIGGTQFLEYMGWVNGYRTKEGRFRRGVKPEKGEEEDIDEKDRRKQKTQSIEILTGEKAV